MLIQKRRAYTLQIHPPSGIVERLTLPTDPPGTNLVNRSLLTGFGALAWVPRGPGTARLAPSGRPLNVEAVQLEERRAFAPVADVSPGQIRCRNRITGHTLTYHFAEEHFDLWLEGGLPQADQVGLDLDVAFMDLRQNDPPEQQFLVQTPYRSLDRSLCFVYLSRPKPPGMLLTCLTPSAGWRLRYGRNGVAPEAYRLPMHALQGLQMLARFHSALDPQSLPGPLSFGLRISFPRDLGEALQEVWAHRGIPLLWAPMLGGQVGIRIPFQVLGAASGVELTAPDGQARRLAVHRQGPDSGIGEIELAAEGFHTLRALDAQGRGGDLVLHAGAPWLETLRRSLDGLEPNAPGNAEGTYWAHAMCLARGWLGPRQGQEGLLYDTLVRIHGQGLPSPFPEAQAVPEPTALLEKMPRQEGYFRGAPCPVPHLWLGKTFSPFHLYRHDRVQDAFALIQLHLLAAKAYRNEEFLARAIRIAQAHLTDNLDENGRIHRLAEDGQDTLDYTTVIAPLQALVDLVVALEAKGDPRAERFRTAAARVADHLVRRGLDFPTEGVNPHVRWTEDGSISCTALSLLYAWWHLERRDSWLEMAGQVLDYHEAWGMQAPDVRMHGSSFRYWETQWEGDGEGRAINAGHAWTLWRAEALYYWALARGDGRRLLQSWNGFETNRCKYQPDGSAYACFTPDFLPDRPRRYALTHDYPRNRDRSLAFYLWPRAAQTWLRSVALVGEETMCRLAPDDARADAAAAGSAGLETGPTEAAGAQGGRSRDRGTLCLNGILRPAGEGVWELEALAPFFDRLFLLAPALRTVRIATQRPLQLITDREDWRARRGRLEAQNPLVVHPCEGVVELVRP